MGAGQKAGKKQKKETDRGERERGSGREGKMGAGQKERKKQKKETDRGEREKGSGERVKWGLDRPDQSECRKVEFTVRLSLTGEKVLTV